MTGKSRKGTRIGGVFFKIRQGLGGNQHQDIQIIMCLIIEKNKVQPSMLRQNQAKTYNCDNLLLCEDHQCSSGAFYNPCDLYILYETKFRQGHGNCPKIHD